MGELRDKIEGIGPGYEKRLAEAEIRTLDDLRYMNVDKVHEQTGISIRSLKAWQSMAVLQRVEGIDSQFSEALVKIGITDLAKLVDADPEQIFAGITELQQKGTIPNTATLEEIKGWQDRVPQILFEDRLSKTPDEVKIVWETMTCRGMRYCYERSNHPCQWFFEYGPFHAYDIAVEDMWPLVETGEIDSIYVGERYQIPELLSGCRKSPIMSVGLNPNLRAVTQPRRIYPYFDDVQQYARHFRHRTTFKHTIEREYYDEHLTNGTAEFEENQPIPLVKAYVSMYREYEKILHALQERMGITDSELSLGEDVSYYNFVACHSPRWNMDRETEKGIIGECYHKRSFFLKQFVQSMPKVVILFGKAIMKSFVANFYGAFDENNIPDPTETYRDVLSKNNYTMRIGGETIRVIFSPHPTGAFGLYLELDARNKIVDAIYEEYLNGNLMYDEDIKHFKRTKGSCKFCDNDIYFMGRCRYKGYFEKEDTRPITEISDERKILVDELESSAQ
ncbi:MAG: DUF4332 domain-containing protein [Methanosarcinales archaeon]|nr:MAG: DUF4332 domain-containing protein [Methanosarcinales archaeon]